MQKRTGMDNTANSAWAAPDAPGEPPAPLPTAILYDPICLEHRVPAGFPERPERLRAIIDRLEARGLLDQALRPALHEAPPEPFIEQVHDPVYVRRARHACESGEPLIDTPDMPLCRRTFDAALAAVRAVLAAVDGVTGDLAGGPRTARNAFCAIRPPGHHALADRAMGFCLFNNIAVAARYALTRGVERVAIVDWDVHHGNGTQDHFYEEPSVLYFSLHRAPFYPGTGAAAEEGWRGAAGANINVPLPSGAGDREYLRALDDVLRPALRSFEPRLLLISAGYDAHRDDPLGGMNCTTDGYAEMTRLVRDMAREHCQDRLVSVLEGGYDLQALADCAEAHVRELMA